MNYLSVCSGIEAASCAWHSLGWSPAAFSEVDAFPCAVLATRFPRVPNLGDMKQFKEWHLGAVDVLVGGTPCQSFSVAGLRKGLDDPRGNLALVYLGIAERFRPQWIVWENVPGVLSSGRGRDFGSFLGALVKLGYGFAYRVLDAQFYGVPQRRRRVFVVGHLGDWRPPAAVLFERESLLGNPAQGRKAKQEVAKALRARSNLSNREDADTLIAYGGNNTSGPINVATAVRAKGGSGHGDFESETFIACTLPASDGGVSSGMHPVVAFQSSQSGVRLSETHATLDANNGSRRHYGVVAPAIAFNARQDPDVWAERTRPLDTDGCTQAVAYQCQGTNVGPMGTLRKGNGNESGGVPFIPLAISGRARGDDGRGYARPEHISEVAGTVDATKPERVLDPRMSVRRLTPLECERLQGFPDNWTLIDYRGKPAKDGPRYKAIGNSMAVPVMRWIGERIAVVSGME